jgi:hypothetical protein
MKLYHRGYQSDVASIMRLGLLVEPDEMLPDNAAGVNLTTGYHYAYPQPWDAWFEIDGSQLDQTKLWNVGEWWWRYDGNVPPGAITVVPSPGERR